MAQGRHETPINDRYYGETYPHSEDISQHDLTENEEMQGPPQNTVSIHLSHSHRLLTRRCLKAPPFSQHFSYAPWNAPPPHPGAQGSFYAAPCANYSATGNAAWHPTPRKFPPVPVLNYSLHRRVLVNNTHFIFRTVHLDTQIREQGKPVEPFPISGIAGTPQVRYALIRHHSLQ